MKVTKGCPLARQTLGEANTSDNEFWVLGIERGRDWISLPRSTETIRPGDRLAEYGELKALRRVFCPAETG
jgi:uncharacterized protein with PhoU and TrkA domain